MDPGIQKALHDKLYEKRKVGALELEKLIRECLASNNHDRIRKIIDQLCNDYAYAVHQPYARNGGLIGLAAAAIALDVDVARYLEKIVPPVLACFKDQDARVRYYACESMYNIAKTSKGEILPYFNDIFDALSKLNADPEASVKNGSELLDRLIKDIVSDSAVSYVSVLHHSEQESDENEIAIDDASPANFQTAFSLPRFIPLLTERIHVLNPFTRTFLVGWLRLLNALPELELVAYLPLFLEGLFTFLNDPNQDVVTATQHCLEKFLNEIKAIAHIKCKVDHERKTRRFDDFAAQASEKRNGDDYPTIDTKHDNNEENHMDADVHADTATFKVASETGSDEARSITQEDWTPGQDVRIDHAQTLDKLVNLARASEEQIQLTALRWIDSFFEICPEEMVSFVPRILEVVLLALSSDTSQVRQAGNRVNTSLIGYIAALPDDVESSIAVHVNTLESGKPASSPVRDVNSGRRSGNDDHNATAVRSPPAVSPTPEQGKATQQSDVQTLDYEAAVNALTVQFLNENEATRAASLSWLIMLQKKAPRKVLAAHDGTFSALLKTLSDPSDTVVTRDLQLLSQISRQGDDSYFNFFMVNLLKLFSSNRKLLEDRGNLIIRQLCNNLSPERIFRTIAECLQKDEVGNPSSKLTSLANMLVKDIEFASIMVQALNNNLITAPELAELRRKLRNWESRGAQSLFVTLFRSWCNNAVATLSLCLLAQAYEQAYNLLQIFGDIEMSVTMLIQIDKLIQLIESPVFTYLRLQLLEPDRFPYLYKCLYGILMLIPQSAQFGALKNRLNSVSAIGYLAYPASRSTSSASAAPAVERANKLKSREDAPVKWSELLERFKIVQEKARKLNRTGAAPDEAEDDDEPTFPPHGTGFAIRTSITDGKSQGVGDLGGKGLRPVSSPEVPRLSTAGPLGASPARELNTDHKVRFGASRLGKLTTGVKSTPKK